MKIQKESIIKVDEKGWRKIIKDTELLSMSSPAFRKLDKYTPKELLPLLEEHLKEARDILQKLMMQTRVPTDKNSKIKYEIIIRDSFVGLMDYLIRIAKLIKVKHVANIANQNEYLSLDEVFYWLAMYATRYLMSNGYKYPTDRFCEVMKRKLDAPILVSPFDSEKDIKNKIEELSSKTGLSQAFNFKSHSQFRSVPAKLVLHFCNYDTYPTDTICFSKYSLSPLSPATIAEWWKAMKPSLETYLITVLYADYPEYYRSLRDDRGDKTPIYIKRKLWLQACKQALKGIAKANTEQAAASVPQQPA